MPLQYKFFVVPARAVEEAEAALNRFLRAVRVVNIQREFVDHGENAAWHIAIEYMAGDGSRKDDSPRARIDYKELLSPEDFTLFARLREWRKEIADSEKVPVYTIFTNEQLARIAEKKITTREGLREIDGIGDARIKKYGDAVIQVVRQETRPENGKVEE